MNRAEQADDPLVRQQAEQRRDVWQAVEVAGFVAGGVMVVSGVLVGVLTRAGGEARRMGVAVAVVPIGNGGVLGAVGVGF